MKFVYHQLNTKKTKKRDLTRIKEKLNLFFSEKSEIKKAVLKEKYFETISATMGAANYKVYNDTKEKIEIYAIQKSYCDLFFVSGASRTTTHILSPGQTEEFKAGADGRSNSFWQICLVLGTA